MAKSEIRVKDVTGLLEAMTYPSGVLIPKFIRVQDSVLPPIHRQPMDVYGDVRRPTARCRLQALLV